MCQCCVGVKHPLIRGIGAKKVLDTNMMNFHIGATYLFSYIVGTELERE